MAQVMREGGRDKSDREREKERGRESGRERKRERERENRKEHFKGVSKALVSVKIGLGRRTNQTKHKAAL